MRDKDVVILFIVSPAFNIPGINVSRTKYLFRGLGEDLSSLEDTRGMKMKGVGAQCAAVLVKIRFERSNYGA